MMKYIVRESQMNDDIAIIKINRPNGGCQSYDDYCDESEGCDREDVDCIDDRGFDEDDYNG